ncbi:MAG: MoxR family ATPase [Planctomycetes bacterium]|nr:MoxR family ATPase [Planctomycetota bacterium]
MIEANPSLQATDARTPLHPAAAARRAAQFRTALLERLEHVVALDRQTVEPLLAALLARGHALIEGIPGIGKTLLARTLARCIDGTFHRIQFTNDLMPSDVVGTSIWRPATGDFTFVEGPLFANVVLADEINRTSPRTLSCLLEAMEDGVVTIDGRPTRLGEPFLVLATRNPIEFHGTFPIPEAALDRFLVRIELGYPSEADELRLYAGHDARARLDEVDPAVTLDEVLALMAAARNVTVTEPVALYAYAVVRATRTHRDVALGASPRAALAWLATARAHALLGGRDHVLPDDLQALAAPVLAHRLFLHGGGDSRPILAELLASTPVEL